MTKKTNIIKKSSKKHILKNLMTRNFRCFENFEHKNLKRGNVFVGDINSCKSCVLEVVGFFLPSLKDHFRIMANRKVIMEDFNILKNYSTILNFAISMAQFFHYFLKKFLQILLKLMLNLKLIKPNQI